MVSGKVKLLGVLGLLGVLSFGGCYTLASSVAQRGSKVGVVNDFYEKGAVFFMSGEGKMAVQGTMPTETFSFSVDPWQSHGENYNELVKKLEEAVDSTKPVVIKYVRPYHGFWHMGSTDYFVTDVKQTTVQPQEEAATGQ